MHIAICDDDKNFIGRLCLRVKNDFMKRLPSDAVLIETFTAGNDLLIAHANKKFDLIFLDVQMKEMDGFSVAEELQEQNNNAIVIFVSSYPAYAARSFRFRPFWFLDKGAPDFDEEFNLAAEAATNKYISKKEVYRFSYNRQDFAIPINDIIYVVYADRGIEIITTKGDYRKYGTMDEAEGDFKPYKFIRTHASYLINPKHITGIKLDDKIIKMTGGYKIPVSRLRKQEVKDMYFSYIESVFP